MKKKFARSITLCLVLACIASALCIGASAEEITPRYTGIFALSADISINSAGRATCYGYVSVKDGYSAKLTVDLVQDDQSIKHWNDSGDKEIEIEESYYVSRGHKYKAVATVSAYGPNGSLVETQEVTSATVSY